MICGEQFCEYSDSLNMEQLLKFKELTDKAKHALKELEEYVGDVSVLSDGAGDYFYHIEGDLQKMNDVMDACIEELNEVQ